MDNKIFMSVIAVTLMSAIVLTLVIPSPVSVGSSSSGETLNYRGNVCIYKNGELVECSHNLLYDIGKNLTRDILGLGGNFIRNISLCNATAGCQVPVAGATETFNRYGNCGLIATQGAYTAYGTIDGNWSVSNTFTASCDSLLVNATRLANASGTLLAGNTFSLVTLQTNDQLTVNWTIQVS